MAPRTRTPKRHVPPTVAAKLTYQARAVHGTTELLWPSTAPDRGIAVALVYDARTPDGCLRVIHLPTGKCFPPASIRVGREHKTRVVHVDFPTTVAGMTAALGAADGLRGLTDWEGLTLEKAAEDKKLGESAHAVIGEWIRPWAQRAVRGVFDRNLNGPRP